MNRSEYKEKSKTAEGRKNLHTELLAEIRTRMDGFIQNAPEANKAKAAALFDKAFKNISEKGNSILFDFYASDDLRDIDFIRYVQNAI